MGKKLAIKGHSTRGAEVIELLKMMGGAAAATKGFRESYCYYITENTTTKYISWDYIGPEEIDKYEIFTLEEFLEKYPFKVGDKVIDEADGCPGVVCEMKWDEDVSDMKYCVAFGNGIDFGWYANDSINFFKIKKNENLEETQSKRDIDKSEFIIKHMILPNKVDDKLEYEIIDGYEFDKVENNKIILKPIKPKYPKTYEECCKVLDWNHRDYDRVGYKSDLLCKLQVLLLCRDAYWEIAGEEMGLGKPWDPDLENEELYCIQNYNKQITISRTNTAFNKILIFPTEEMRDIFYENFKDLIEQCKELL